MSEIKYIGQMSSSQNSRVIDPEGISYAVTNGHKDGEPKIIEPIGCAMRGRNPENPSERGRSNGKYKQRIEMGSNISNTITSVQKDSLVAEPNVLTPKRTDFGKQVRKQYESGELDMSRHDMTELEPRTDGVSNTLTSVQKDNLLAEPRLIEVGNLVPQTGKWMSPQRGRVFSPEGIAPSMDTCSGGNREPKIIDDIYKDREARVYDDIAPTMRSGHDTMKVAEPIRIPQATKQGYIEVPQGAVFDMSYPESTTSRGSVQEGETFPPTLMASGEAPCLFEGVSVHPNSHALEFKGEKSIKTDASPDLRATDYKAPHCVWENSANYRIRKLTPKECFRLMGVSEKDIEKIQNSGVSQSQQYKMAGNSIVVDVLEHIFRKLFVDTGQESQQLLLF